MTQIASGRRAHQLTVSGHGIATTVQHMNPQMGLFPKPQASATTLGQDPEPGMETAGTEELLAEVWRTSSYLETVQWELDNAHQSLQQALQQAASSGVDHGALLQAANLTSEELETALLEGPDSPGAF
ncbi:hypothetical protein [Pseudarthrobacter sp. NamE5]|uniref:hypothetical protein n=1 Tax=Pseudarthrobacter sp. NamE5 TaxID=2576839 RepID=UPI00110BAB4C|nr:hypothetical protein [Pseudarthrobacter sp. NamE5]TLM88039.1 hypothetical protein FDW84_00485 [Pseudarthrobacter sp. NamE5]